VVGAGVIGASIAQQLARDGTETVVVCEQYWGGAQTATTQSGGILRLHHTVGCDVGLAARSLPTYQRFGEVVGGDCGYVPVGFALLIGANHTDALVRNVDTVRSCGGRTELLEPEQLVRSYPGLRLGGFAAAAYEPDCGYGDPATTARALLAAAEAAGAMLLRGVRVERLLTHGERISGVRTTVGDIPAATVVLAAGAASAALARTIGLVLQQRGVILCGVAA